MLVPPPPAQPALPAASTFRLLHRRSQLPSQVSRPPFPQSKHRSFRAYPPILLHLYPSTFARTSPFAAQPALATFSRCRVPRSRVVGALAAKRGPACMRGLCGLLGSGSANASFHLASKLFFKAEKISGSPCRSAGAISSGCRGGASLALERQRDRGCVCMHRSGRVESWGRGVEMMSSQLLFRCWKQVLTPPLSLSPL